MPGGGLVQVLEMTVKPTKRMSPWCPWRHLGLHSVSTQWLGIS